MNNNQETIKKCGDCMAEIPQKAKKCRYCGSKQKAGLLKEEVGLKHLFLIVIIIVILGSIFSGGSDTPNTQTTSRTSSYLSVGQAGILNNNDNLLNCEGIVSIAFTEKAFDDLTNASVARDSYGYQQVFQQGFATTVENCTRVKAIDSAFAKTKVRLIDNPSIAGWVPYEWAIAQ